MNQVIICVHRWGAAQSTLDAEMRHCRNCDSWWVSDNVEPRVVIGKIVDE